MISNSSLTNSIQLLLAAGRHSLMEVFKLGWFKNTFGLSISVLCYSSKGVYTVTCAFHIFQSLHLLSFSSGHLATSRCIFVSLLFRSLSSFSRTLIPWMNQDGGWIWILPKNKSCLTWKINFNNILKCNPNSSCARFGST